MSSVAFRDSSVIVIETGRTRVRAGFGLHELLRLPTIDLPARVGLRARLGLTSRASGQDDANANGTKTPKANIRASDYLVGKQLDDALAAGEDIVVSWPFANGDISDFVQAEAIWKHVLFALLGIKRAHNESPTLLSFPHGLSRDAHEKVCQIFFERFNTASFSVLERPLSQLYAVNALSGLIIDIGQEQTDITPVYDCMIQHGCCESIPIGVNDCEKYIASIFRKNQDIVNTLSPPEAPLTPEQLSAALLELVQKAWRDGLMKATLDREAALDGEDEGVTNIAAVVVAGKEKAVIETGMKKRAIAKATAAEQARAKEIEARDLVTIEFGGKSVTIDKERHRFCEPLFDPRVLQGVAGIEKKEWKSGSPMTLQEACGLAVSRADLIARTSIWEGVFVTGEITSLVKGVGAALQSRLSPYLLGNPDLINEVQPKHVRILHVPEYFAEYRDKGDSNAAFLGASIVAKVIIFSDPAGKNFVSKADYTAKGPRAVLEMTPSLL